MLFSLIKTQQMLDQITHRFIQCHNYLKETGAIRSSSAFASEIGTHRQTLNAILKGKRAVKIEMIKLAVERYFFNPYYILSGIGEKFVNPNLEDKRKADNIRLIPIKAQAGYNDHIIDPVFQSKLPQFSIPIAKFNNGEFSAFEVEGESMLPTLEDGDVLICSKLDPNYYANTIKDGLPYVVVTKNEVLVKRVKNKIHGNKLLILISDNASYKNINLRMDKVLEIWKVEGAVKYNLPPQVDPKDKIDEKLSLLLAEVKKLS